MASLSRIQSVVLLILRAALPGVKVGSWVEDVDYGTFPLINVRRDSGARHSTRPNQLSLPVIEMAAYGPEGLPETEELYEGGPRGSGRRCSGSDHRGYLHSILETQGASQAPSPFTNTWCVRGSVRLGLRPVR